MPDETLSKNDLPVNSSTEAQRDVNSTTMAYQLIMVMQFDCFQMCDLHLQSSHEPKVKRLAHENVTAGMHLQKLPQVTNWCDF